MRHLKPLVLLTTLSCLISLYTCQDVKKINDCMCKFSNGSVIDLSSVGYQNNTARFSDVIAPNNTDYTYFYNPCYPFNLGGCSNVAVCQKKLIDGQYFNVGNPTTTFWMNNSQLTIIYNSTDQSQTKRASFIKLVCDSENTVLEAEGEYPVDSYVFTLRSKCACSDACKSANSQDEGMSTGSVLVILLFVFVLCYLLGGIIFQKVMKGATGRELFPNYEFWMDFPLLVRDGVIFACNGCQNEVSYERI